MTRETLRGVIALTLRREGVNHPGLVEKLIDSIDMAIELSKVIQKESGPALPPPNYLEQAEAPAAPPAAAPIPIAVPVQAPVPAPAPAPTRPLPGHVMIVPYFPMDRLTDDDPIWTVSDLTTQLSQHAPEQIEFPFTTLDNKSAVAVMLRNIIPMHGTDTVRLEYKAAGAQHSIAFSADQHDEKIDVTALIDKVKAAGAMFFQVSHTAEPSIPALPPIHIPEAVS